MTILELPCSGEMHRIEIRDNGTAVMLDHNEKTLRAFLAFDSEKPACLVIHDLINTVHDVYRLSLPVWDGVHWDHVIGINKINVKNLTSQEAHDTGVKEMANEAARIRMAKKNVDKAWRAYTQAQMAEGEEAVPVYFLRNEVREAEDALERERAIVSDWRRAWQYILKAERQAEVTKATMRMAQQWVIQGAFTRAWAAADEAWRAAARGGYAGAGSWRSYVNNLFLLKDAAEVFGVRVVERNEQAR